MTHQEIETMRAHLQNALARRGIGTKMAHMIGKDLACRMQKSARRAHDHTSNDETPRRGE